MAPPLMCIVGVNDLSVRGDGPTDIVSIVTSGQDGAQSAKVHFAFYLVNHKSRHNFEALVAVWRRTIQSNEHAHGECSTEVWFKMVKPISER